MLEGGRPTPGFAHNGIKTSKYNPVTFLPIFLFEMFSRAAYLYFLIQVPPSIRSIPTSTCLPIFLFEMFSRAAYLCLLMQVQYCPPNPPPVFRASLICCRKSTRALHVLIPLLPDPKS